MQEVSGEDDKVHFWILGFFNLTHQAIVISRLHLYFEDLNLRKREYRDRIHAVESASITPLVFSTFGGLGREAIIFIVI